MCWYIPYVFLPQKILQEFVNIEMIFHAKALEMYTQCFQNLNSISEEEDLEVHWIIIINHKTNISFSCGADILF